MKKIINTFILFAVAHVALSQQSRFIGLNQNDPNYPAKGRFNAGILTTYSGKTPPPVLFGNITYGISNKFSAGIVGGTTGNLSGLGIKLNAVLLQRNSFRMAFRMLSVYYPERNGKYLFDRKDLHVMPWMLSMGVVDTEWRTSKGIRWALGVGLLETHCIDGMKRWFSNLGNSHPESEVREEGELPFEVFTSLQGGVSIPVSKRFTFHPEVFTVLHGGKLIKSGEHRVGFPIIATVSLTYAF
jgi:hypothetical protein